MSTHYENVLGVQPISVSQTDIEAWFSSDLGQRVLFQEQEYLDSLLADMFGYHLMQLSVLNQKKLFDHSPTSHQFTLKPRVNDVESCDASMAISEFENLPIESDAIDVVLLHHVLEYSLNPHQLLREAARTLIPNGHLILIGFNPYSLLGMVNPLANVLSRSRVYRRHHLSVGRLKDWCKVLELELLDVHKGYYGLPLNNYYSPKLDRMGQCILSPLGGFYILVIRKNITPMTMIKNDWKKRRMLPRWNKGVVTSSVSSSTKHSEKR